MGVFYYLNDILLLAPSPIQLLEHKEIVLTTLAEFWWLVNPGKGSSHPDPVNGLSRGDIQHFSRNSMSPSPEGGIDFPEMSHVRTLSHLSVSGCLSLIGTMSSCILMLPWAHWHLRFF